MRNRTLQYVWIVIFLVVFTWSAVSPHDYPTWFLEVFPAVLGAAIIWYTRDTYPLTQLTYILILIHCVILMVGGHYTYAEVPLFEWIKDEFGQQRNNYDKLGHFVQGCLGFSAFYELIEWWVALLSEEAAESFLGTQGYIFDTQSDMFYALVGAVLGLLLLGKLHDKQLLADGYIDQVPQAGSD
jgi:putative membrane protein